MHRFLLLALSLLPCACSTSAPAPCSCCGFGSGANAPADTFLDTNDDGLPDTRVPATAAFVDTNDDGLVSKAEYLAKVPNGTGWSDKDVNRDGFISEREAYDYTKARYEANGKKIPKDRFAAFPE